MSEIVCLNCGCGPHTDKTCSRCGRCKSFIRADLQGARAMIQINNILLEHVPAQTKLLVDLIDIICEAFPGVEERVVAKREALQKEREANARANSGADQSSVSGVPSGEDSGSGSAREGFGVVEGGAE